MKYRRLGRSDIFASVVGFGMWGAGTAAFISEKDDAEKLNTLSAAIDYGVTLFDTAPLYGYGHAEELLGRAVIGRRDQVVIVSKCGLWWKNDTRDFAFERDGQRVYRSLTPEHMRHELEDSLKRLNTDYIDLYMTHWPERGAEATPIEVTMDTLLKFKKEGKIRAIGACNVTLTDIQRYQSIGQLDAIQNHYSLLSRDALESGQLSIQDWTIDQQIAVLAWSPLERGVLTGKFGLNYQPKSPFERRESRWFRPQQQKGVIKLLSGWQDLVQKYDCSLTQLVLAWTMARPGITSVLVGARKIMHLQENVISADIQLSAEDRARMDKAARQLIIQHEKTPH